MIKPNMDKTRSRRLFHNVHRSRLRTIALLPSMITLANGICGFAAIGLVSKGSQYYALAGYMIFFAMIADTLSISLKPSKS